MKYDLRLSARCCHLCKFCPRTPHAHLFYGDKNDLHQITFRRKIGLEGGQPFTLNFFLSSPFPIPFVCQDCCPFEQKGSSGRAKWPPTRKNSARMRSILPSKHIAFTWSRHNCRRHINTSRELTFTRVEGSLTVRLYYLRGWKEPINRKPWMLMGTAIFFTRITQINCVKPEKRAHCRCRPCSRLMDDTQAIGKITTALHIWPNQHSDCGMQPLHGLTCHETENTDAPDTHNHTSAFNRRQFKGFKYTFSCAHL